MCPVKKTIVYIGLGSNLEQPTLQIKNAITALQALADTTVLRNSGYYASKPMGPEDQPDYLNAVVELETSLSAMELLSQCQNIEKQQGRVKNRVWGERTIDLDILLYGDQQIKTDRLVVPHPGICQRDFVYLPLLKLKPEIIIPGKGLLNVIIRSEKLASGDVVNTDYSCQFAGNIE
jgi:2-amino-4-hydroxy-6-hydroxymethyldihydropteridine diphosphokinase